MRPHPRPIPRILPATAAAVAFLLAGTGASSAENLSIQAEGSGRYEYDSNPLLSSTHAEALSGFVASPKLTVRDETPFTYLELTGRVDAGTYNRSDYNSNDVFLTFLGSRTGPSWTASLSGAYDDDTTRTSEVAGSGILKAGSRHQRYFLAPHFAKNLTQIDSLLLDAAFTASRYADHPQYVDSNTWSFTPSFQHEFSATDSGSAGLGFSQYVTASGPKKTQNTLTPSLGWQSRLSERWQMQTSAGVQYTSTDDDRAANADNGTSWNYYANAGLNFQGEQDALSLQFTHQMSPEGTGTQAETSSVSLSGTHTVNSNLDLKLSLSYLRSDGSGTSNTVSNTGEHTYWNVSPGITYHLMRQVDVVVSYNHREQEYASGSSQASSDVFLISLTYKPDKIDLM